MLFVDSEGQCPFVDDWLASRAITTKDRAKIEARFKAIEESFDELPPQWWASYKSSNGLYELRVVAQGRKQLRPLGVRADVREVLFFYGSVEKNNNLDNSDIRKAESLKRNHERGNGSKRSWK